MIFTATYASNTEFQKAHLLQYQTPGPEKSELLVRILRMELFESICFLYCVTLLKSNQYVTHSLNQRSYSYPNNFKNFRVYLILWLVRICNTKEMIFINYDLKLGSQMI